MHVFITGGSGWIGTPVVAELLAAGHRVTGLARSDASAGRLADAGAEPLRGDIRDVDLLRAGVAASDAVIHLGYIHDFGDYVATGLVQRAAVQGIADELAGTDRPFLFASGVAVAAGGMLTEADRSPDRAPESPRGGSENLALDAAALPAPQRVRSVALRFAPTVHGPGDHGFVAVLTRIARERGVAGYIGDGANRWPAVHRLDAAHLVTLALDAPAGTVVHAVAEEGIPTRRIAEAIGAAVGVPTASIPPEDAAAHFGWLGGFFGLDVAASSARTRAQFGWMPTHPTLEEDLAGGAYAAVATASE